ncbi:MAG: HAMP domain-containing histidine kinase [Bacilli bacterium]|nr:HAMP domain-containing histidine kinase [Bacilli bacterium]
MSKFRRNSIIIIALELISIAVFNVIVFTSMNNQSDREYRVDIKRVEHALQAGETINVDDYQYITNVVEYKEGYSTNSDYAVVNANGKQYSIEYTNESKSLAPVFMNVGMGVTLLLTAGVLIYIDNKVLKPFNKISNYSTELAKGNLTNPMKEEKSKHFGQFVWGMDMLRETLEENKKHELKLQKDKKTLILSISHDIKTPLSAIKLYTKALKEDIYDTPEKKAEALNGIEKNVGEIEHHVSEIVTASKEDFLNLTVKQGETYLANILGKIEILYKEKFSTLHTKFSIGPFENVLVKGDEDRLEEVIQNILENAIKYGDGRYVRIEIGEEENYKLIAITNSGCSIKEDELPHLFDSFYRGSNVSNKEGSGLGLYIAKTLMHMMNGDIFAKINGDEFTVVTVVKKC